MAEFYPRFMQRTFDAEISKTAQRYAKALGIPAVFVNKCGRFDSPTPAFPYTRYRAPFAGFNAIADSDGKLLDQTGKEQAVLVATIHLDENRKTRRPLPAKGKWVSRMPGFVRWYMEYVGMRGKASYLKNKRRKAASKTASVNGIR